MTNRISPDAADDVLFTFTTSDKNLGELSDDKIRELVTASLHCNNDTVRVFYAFISQEYGEIKQDDLDRGGAISAHSLLYVLASILEKRLREMK